MRAALNLAARGLGRVAPNPAVGCLLVKAGRVIGRGWTQPGGRPHAETEALRQAGDEARNACAYVTLEPCSHHGRTAPCADALIAAGISRCVVALEDPDGRVQGRGIERLREAGIEVVVGSCADQARALNAGFLHRVIKGRPLVTLKVASSLDGRIATRSGQSQWITGPAARARGHLLRASHDAIMVGSGTAVADNPRLDVRLPGLAARSPLRVVLDGRLRLPLEHDLVARAGEQPSLLFTRGSPTGERTPAERTPAERTGQDCAERSRLQKFRDAGVEVVEIAGDEKQPLPLAEVLTALGNRGVTRLLIEGGGMLAGSFLGAGLVDRIAWFRSGGIIGGDGLPAIGGFGLDRLADIRQFSLQASYLLAEDCLEMYQRREAEA